MCDFLQKTFFHHERPPFTFFGVLQQNGCWKVPKGPPFQFFWSFASEWMLKNPKGSSLSVFFGIVRLFSKKKFFIKVVPIHQYLEILKFFYYFWALDMAPTWAVPGLFHIQWSPDSCEKAEVAMFADDTSFIISWTCVDPLPSQEISCVRDWFTSNKLRVNPGKCEAMFCFWEVIRNQNRGLWFILENILLMFENSLAQTAFFRELINYFAGKTNKFCCLKFRVRHFILGNVFQCFTSLSLNEVSTMVCWFIVVQQTPRSKNWMCIEQNSESNFFKTKMDSMANALANNKILNVFRTFHGGSYTGSYKTNSWRFIFGTDFHTRKTNPH